MDKKNTVLWLVSNQRWSKYWVSKHWIADFESKERPIIYISPFQPSLNPKNWSSFDIEYISDNLLEVIPYYPKGFYRFPLSIRTLLIRFFANKLNNYLLDKFGDKKKQLLSFDTSWSLSNINDLFMEHIYYPVDPPMGWGREKEDVLAHQKADRSFCISKFRQNEIKNKYNLDIIALPHAAYKANGVDSNFSVFNNEKTLVENIRKKNLTPVCYIGSINRSCFDTKAVEKLVSNENICLVVYSPKSASALSVFDERMIVHHERIDYRGPLNFEDVGTVTSLYDFGFIPYDVSRGNKWEMRSPFKAANYLAAGIPFLCPEIPASSDYQNVASFYYDINDIENKVDVITSSEFKDNYSVNRTRLLEKRRPEVIIEKIFPFEE